MHKSIAATSNMLTLCRCSGVHGGYSGAHGEHGGAHDRYGGAHDRYVEHIIQLVMSLVEVFDV